MTRPHTPADVRALRQLALEVRLCIGTACLRGHRMAPFVRDASLHLALLRDLLGALQGRGRATISAPGGPGGSPELAQLEALALRAHLALLPARRRRCKLHWRVAWCEAAAALLVAFERRARRIENDLWET